MLVAMDRYQAMIPLAVALGAAIGGLGRWWCSGLIARGFGETFPFGTLAVNVLGSFLIGAIAVVTGPDGRILVAPAVRQGVMVGVLGGFTTFSSFSLQTLALMHDGEWLYAAGNVVLSVVLCLAGVWLGFALGTWINR
jgi:CrcB protein